MPYPSFGGMTSTRLPPTFIPSMPLSHPLMTSPAYRVKSILPASNSDPSESKVPRYRIVTVLPFVATSPSPMVTSVIDTFMSSGSWNSTPGMVND